MRSLIDYSSLLANAAVLSTSRRPEDTRLAIYLREKAEEMVRTDEDLARHLAKARQSQEARARAYREKVANWKKNEAPKLWAEFHRWSRQPAGDFAQWMKKFISRILCGECKTNFIAHLEARGVLRWNGRDYSIEPPAGDLFAFSVDLHNDVNKASGVPLFTLEDAALRWA